MDPGAVLCCACVAETLDDAGSVLRRRVIKKAFLDLGRNEQNDIVLRVTHQEGKEGPFIIREHQLYKKFWQEGKATIKLIPQRLQLMVSNCPPEQLGLFLRCLLIKIKARGKLQGSQPTMLGDKSREFNEISPINARDLKKAEVKLKVQDNTAITPRRRETIGNTGIKRKLNELRTDPANQHSEVSMGSPAKKRKPQLVLQSSSAGLSDEQCKVIELVRNGESVFFTGSAGTGKSFLLQRIVGILPPEVTYPTASTGAAACLISGTTLHSFAGMGIGSGSLQQCIALASREHKAANWKKCRTLIIDEISMVDADYFDKLEAVARAVRKSSKPFGGIQLVLCGDFLQLPPVAKDGNKKYCFQAKSWQRCITRSMELTQIYRQNDRQFIAVLQNIRIGRCPPAVTRLLKNTENQQIEKCGIKATCLYTHTEEAETTNKRELEALPGEGKTFLASDSNQSTNGKVNSLCPVPSVIELKTGAQVMLVKNINVQKGLVNGARGVVMKFDSQGLPVVRFSSGLMETVGYERWSFRLGGGSTTWCKQLPLQLAWAISIHKSQGMTLDCVEISLARAFESGQAYVALSRAKSLNSLRVKGFTSGCVQADPDVLDYYRTLRQMRRNYIEDCR